METLELDLSIKRYPIVLKSGDSQITAYMSVMTSADRDEYFRTIDPFVKRAKKDPDNMIDQLGTDRVIVAYALKKEDGSRYDTSELEGWPNNVITKLVEKFNDINELGKSLEAQESTAGKS